MLHTKSLKFVLANVLILLCTVSLAEGQRSNEKGHGGLIFVFWFIVIFAISVFAYLCAKCTHGEENGEVLNIENADENDDNIGASAAPSNDKASNSVFPPSYEEALLYEDVRRSSPVEYVCSYQNINNPSQ